MSEFIVHTYVSEIEFVKWLVICKENIETGGDLFGLWINKNELVIQIISGPGQKCERSQVSFYQEVGYLKNVGEHLTINEGLCNVGEWHSHHRLGLARPSLRDEQTVWGNMLPLGLTKFVLFIANISAGSKKAKVQDVNIGCFLFDKANDKVITGRLVFVSEDSPLRRKPEIEKVLEKGAEKQEQEKQATPSNKKRKNRQNRRKNKTISPSIRSSVEDNEEVLDEKDEGERVKKISNRREERKGDKNDKIAKKEKTDQKNEIGERCKELNEGKQKQIVNCNEMKDGEKIEENEEREESNTNGKLETENLKEIKQELKNEENNEKVDGAEKEQENQNNQELQDKDINPDATEKSKMNVQEKELGMKKENEDASQKEGKETKTVFHPKHQGNNKSKKKPKGNKKKKK